MTNPRIIFFGTSEFAVEAFETLRARGTTPELVVTETDKPKGRGHIVSEPPVKQWAQKHGLRIFQPAVFDKVACQNLRASSPDLFIVAAYGKILPKTILAIPPKGALNIHPSLLPKYRGASPVRSGIVADDREMGVSIIQIDEKMDHGPIAAQKSVSFDPWPPDADSAELTMAREGAGLLADILPDWLSGKIQAIPQDDALATFTTKIAKENGRVSPDSDAHKNWLIFNAYRTSPGVFFASARDGKEIRVKITEAGFENGVFKILRVIPENKREMPYEDFLRGAR